MTIHEWKHMTGPQIDAIDRSRAVVMVACSPLEVHGPHLPVVTDNYEAERLADRTMEMLGEQHPEIVFLKLPSLYVAADVVPQPGSLMFRSSTITRVLTDLGRSLCKQGFRHIWVSSFHGGPRHFVPIEHAAHTVNRRYGGEMVSVFSLLINRLTGGRTDLMDVLGNVKGLDVETLRGDTHGGVVETSMMLHWLREHVQPGYRDLERVTVNSDLERRGIAPLAEDGRPSLGELLRGFKHKLKYFERQSYAGKPSAASAELGAEIADVLARHSADALSERWSGQLPLDACRSPLWPIRWVFLSEQLSWLFERAMRYQNRVF